jgi:hypothetical protein
MKLDRATLVGVLASGLVLVVACSSSDPAPSGTSGGTSGATSGGTDSGTSGSTDSGTSGSSDSGQGKDAGEGGDALLANGATCVGDADCMSGHCLAQGAGMGSTAGVFCTIPCTMPGAADPAECADTAIFSGKCSGKGFCQRK